MPSQSTKDRFSRLPLFYKLTGIGAILAMISVFLPWYQDFDAFNTGERFLGINGPLYLVGYIVLALGLFSIILTAYHFFEKKLPPLPLKESLIYILTGATSIFLIVIANSVYFHPKFGTNITSKVMQYGMVIAFIGAIITLVGGILKMRERGTSRLIQEFQEETQPVVDPVLELNNFQQEQEAQKPWLKEDEVRVHDSPTTIENEDYQPLQESTPQPIQPPVQQPTAAQASMRKSATGVREYKAKPTEGPQNQPTQVRSEPFPDTTFLKEEAHDHSDRNQNSALPMDL